MQELTREAICKDFLQVQIESGQEDLGKKLSAIMKMDWNPEVVLGEERRDKMEIAIAMTKNREFFLSIRTVFHFVGA